ncbi:BlaI/MecI/CopY family transcriptional regulator [Simiduia aestuariiviva]|uniref:Putative transcriptional regulator n=1 Tax=Simiduia aestuariiviva TaxID=1510459 RepID=A0A839UME6_9GAMM|nr:BlaI/MecI/CopY family transcriptional regulator [Simiduia aestuariiviva]MBB3167719.1 putative transcriptional regulator [Simiduia aestuariiviva]
MEHHKPSPTELTLLKSLWRQEPQSARELHDQVQQALGWSYSSTRKTLDRMVEKTLVVAEEVHGLKVYRAKASKVSTLAHFVKDFSRRVLEVDGPLPVSMFVDSKLLDPSEMRDLERLLAEQGDEDE